MLNNFKLTENSKYSTHYFLISETVENMLLTWCLIIQEYFSVCFLTNDSLLNNPVQLSLTGNSHQGSALRLWNCLTTDQTSNIFTHFITVFPYVVKFTLFIRYNPLLSLFWILSYPRFRHWNPLPCSFCVTLTYLYHFLGHILALWHACGHPHTYK